MDMKAFDTDEKLALHPARTELADHLLDAIERIRDDVTKIEIWAYALTGFSQPIPDYEPEDMRVWMPTEQARRLNRG